MRSVSCLLQLLLHQSSVSKSLSSLVSLFDRSLPLSRHNRVPRSGSISTMASDSLVALVETSWTDLNKKRGRDQKFLRLFGNHNKSSIKSERNSEGGMMQSCHAHLHTRRAASSSCLNIACPSSMGKLAKVRVARIEAAAAVAATSFCGNDCHSSSGVGKYVWRAAIVDLRAGGRAPS